MKGLFANGDNNWVKSIGVYLIIILALLRFLIYPLHAAVKDRRVQFDERRETYMLKSRLLQQARRAMNTGPGKAMDKVRLSLYPREAGVSEIQADVLAAISQYAEQKGVTVSAFEMPEAVAGKKISEVSVIIRFTGSAKSFIELLTSIRDNKKILAVRTIDVSVNGQSMAFSMTVSTFRVEV